MNKRPNRLFIAPWIALCFGLSACASSMVASKPEDPRGLIDLNARVPSGQSPYGIAYGAPTRARVRPQTPDIDAYLKPEPAKMARPTRVAIARAEVAEKVAAPAVATPKPAATEPVAAAAAPEQAPLLAMASEPAPATGDDGARYADREAKSQQLEQFRGGDAVVITSGALIIVLLIVILILLLR